MKKFDAIVIGTGQAGPSLAESLGKNGFKTAIIEKSDLGGTCVNTGCTPTKAYIASARRAYIASNSEEMGVSVEGFVTVNLQKIKERKNELIADSHSGLEKMFSSNENIMLMRGKAIFVNNTTVEVNGEQISAEKVYINVGGRPRIPEGFQKVNYLTNRSILELEEIPEHLVIVGGGYVGLEFGQMFRRFGSKVTILERGEQLLKREDDDIAEIVAQILIDSGIEVLLNSECISATEEDGRIIVSYDCQEGRKTISSPHVLVAAGRVPNTDDLGLENTEVAIDEGGFIKVNNELRSSASNIWALGDCNGEGAFTHTAYNDFQIVNSHLFEDRKRYLSDRFTCYALFVDPAVARVGMNEKEIKEKGIPAKVAMRPMKKIARAKEIGETTGLLKIFLEAETNKILGATFVGPGADEYIHTVIDHMYAGNSYEVIRDAVHIHPTISELIPTLLQNPKDL